MLNNFNDTINNIQEFNLEPSKEVWNEIEKKLNDNKKKRIIGWWWSMPVLFICIGFVYYLNTKQSNSNQTNIAIYNTKDLKELINVENENIDNPKLNYDSEIKKDMETKNVKLYNKIEYKKSVAIIKNEASRQSNNLNTLINITQEIPEQKIDKLINVSGRLNEQNFLKDDIAKSSIKLKQTESLTTTELSNTKNEKVQSADKLETTVTKLVTENKETNKKYSKKIRYSFSVSGGINYVSKNNVFGEEKVIGGLNSSFASGPSTGITNYNNLILPKPGSHFSLGISLEYSLSQKISLQSGLLYRYLQNNNQLVQDSVLSYPANYYSSNKSNYNSYSNQFEVPINLKFCLNPKSKNKFSILTGINMAWIFNDNWLVMQNNIGRYQSVPEQNRRLLFGMQTGIGINFNNKIDINIIARKYITPTQNTGTNYFWQQLDCQINIPLKKSIK